ncbi:membrane protein [Clostridium beijerinckii]|uniref:membrane protein n=1 Tax=Clostridium beijerinckii TaxID=1520 RepID=UPI00047B3173|nr:membrane protein [Clostridium beijerinckii]
MKFISYLRVELSRIFHSKIVYLIMVLTMICPLAGYNLYKPVYVSTLSGDLIANPVMAGAIGGGILFALLTLLEFNRVKKYETEALTNSIVSPLILNIVKLFTLMVAAIVSVSIAAAIYYPYTFLKMNNIFDIYTYLNSFFLLMLPSIFLSILVVSAFYQIFSRTDVSMIAFIGILLVGFSKWFERNNILHWINPPMPALSDDFSNDLVFRLMKHNRLFWLLVFGGIWIIGLLCVRRYGKGLFKSILYNSRKIYIPVLAVVLISSAVYTYRNQPNIYLESEVYHNENDINKELELSNTNLDISFNTNKGSLSGKATYTLQNLSCSEQECKITSNPGFKIYHITANGKEVTFRNFDNKKNDAIFTLPDDSKIILEVEYSGVPKLREEEGDLTFAPNDINDKCIDLYGQNVLYPYLRVEDSKNGSPVNGKFTMPSGLIPIVYGEPYLRDDATDDKTVVNVSNNEVKLFSEDGKNKTWLFKLDGGCGATIIAGDYVVKQLGNKSMPIEFYYSSKMEERMKNMNAQTVMNDTIKFCTSHYGKLHDVSFGKPLRIAERTVFFGCGLGLANLSTMPESSFSDKNLSNESRGAATKAEVMGHEISHQWWSFQNIGDGGDNPNWSAEGLAVYTTYRIAKETHGEEYAKENYIDIWKKGAYEQDNNFYNRHPEYLKMLPEKYADEIKGCNRAVREYEKLPLQILKASQLVGGEENMDKILGKLYENSSKTKRISWQDFLDACNLKEEDLNVD